MANNIEESISPMVRAPPSANPFGMPPLTTQVTEVPTPVPEGPESPTKHDYHYYYHYYHYYYYY